MELIIAISPLLLTLAAGYVLAASGVLPKENWGEIEVLSFRLLIPAFLIKAIAEADLSAGTAGPFALALVVTVMVAGGLVLLLRPVINHNFLPNPRFTTLFQTTTRFNGFIALAAAELMLGEVGLSLIAVAMAALIPLINIMNISVLTVFGTGRASVLGISLTILKNPLVQGSVIGIIINLSGISLPAAISGALDLIGRAALGVGVLAVGAGISLRRLLRPSGPLVLGLFLRLMLAPALFLAVAYALDLSPLQTLCGVFVMSAPAATNGYIVARQMGGDAELYADILTWQTILSMGLLPLAAVVFAV